MARGGLGNTHRLEGSSHLAMPVILSCFPRRFWKMENVLLAALTAAVAYVMEVAVAVDYV